jgi:hypothetical protein
MTAPLPGSPFPGAGKTSPLRQAIQITLSPFFLEPPAASPVWQGSDKEPVEMESRLHRMQQLICELLVKNQQLRMALLELKTQAMEDRDGGN